MKSMFDPDCHVNYRKHTRKIFIITPDYDEYHTEIKRLIQENPEMADEEKYHFWHVDTAEEALRDLYTNAKTGTRFIYFVNLTKPEEDKKSVRAYAEKIYARDK